MDHSDHCAELEVFKYFLKKKVLLLFWSKSGGGGGDCPSISDGPGAKTKQAQSSSTVALANMPLFFFFWPTKHYTFIHCCDFVLCTQFLWVMSFKKKKSFRYEIITQCFDHICHERKIKDCIFMCRSLPCFLQQFVKTQNLGLILICQIFTYSEFFISNFDRLYFFLFNS